MKLSKAFICNRRTRKKRLSPFINLTDGFIQTAKKTVKTATYNNTSEELRSEEKRQMQIWCKQTRNKSRRSRTSAFIADNIGRKLWMARRIYEVHDNMQVTFI